MGLGIAVLPVWLIEEDLLSGRLMRILPSWHAKPLPAQIIYLAERTMPLRVTAFIDFATEYMKTVLKQHDGKDAI